MHVTLAKLVAIGAMIAAAVVCNAAISRADAPSEREYILKAAFVYNFGKFVDWPPAAFASDRAPLVVCVHGERAFKGMAATLRTKSVNDRPIAVVDAHSGDAQLPCNIVFFGDDDDPHLDALRAGTVPGVLTVGDSDDFIRAGGMVGLITVENKIRFEVNLAACRQAGLRISATLLRLAKTVLE